MKQEIFIKKLDIDKLLEVLEMLYGKGADYVDVLITKENENIDLFFSSKDEYYTQKINDDLDSKISEDNLNDFIL